jgi:hypothetical protein
VVSKPEKPGFHNGFVKLGRQYLEARLRWERQSFCPGPGLRDSSSSAVEGKGKSVGSTSLHTGE